MNIKLLYLFITGTLTLFSCASSLGTKNMYFEYEKPSVHTDKGFINLTLNPSPRTVSEGEIETVVWTEPYRFNTQYISLEGMFTNGEIRNLRIESVQTSNVVHEDEILIDSMTRFRPNDEHTKGLKDSVGFGVGPLVIPYDDYKVSFKFTIFAGDGKIYDQGEIEAVIRKKYFETTE